MPGALVTGIRESVLFIVTGRPLNVTPGPDGAHVAARPAPTERR
jgi:hypothetical protein